LLHKKHKNSPPLETKTNRSSQRRKNDAKEEEKKPKKTNFTVLKQRSFVSLKTAQYFP